jgi:two-component system NtrC family sensor kinase
MPQLDAHPKTGLRGRPDRFEMRSSDRRFHGPKRGGTGSLEVDMKLVPKLGLAFIGGVSVILAVNGYLRVQREVGLFESNRVHDDALIGRTLSAAVAGVWSASGTERAVAVVERAAEQSRRLRIRWIWLDDPDATLPSADQDKLRTLAPDAPLTLKLSGDAGEDRRYTFVRVAGPEPRPAAIEVSEPLETERAYIRQTVVDTVVTTLTLDAFCAALAMVLGVWLVGRPMGELMEKARRVGRGDFGGALHLRQKDELAELATEMNAMCVQLIEAKERVAAEAQARIAMMEQLRHADRLMTVGKLASGIAHELGTPLNVVEARASMIADGETSPKESAEFARIIVRASEQMTRIIRQVLAFARPRSAQKAECDLALIAKRTVELLKPFADKKQIALELEGGAESAPAQADAGQIEQAMTNLVMNAIQATDGPGSVSIAIDLATARPPADHGADEGEFVRVRVTDGGAGIAPEHLAHIFEPFFTTKDVGEGTGLGLSITYGIVREHGGWIGVDSEPGRGTEFSVYLPLPAG